MSQHDRMYPMINIDGAIYDNQPYQFNDTCPQQWMSSSPRTVIPIAPSPTNTTRTSWTAPLRTANHLNVQRLKKVTQQQRNIDPSLQGSHPYLLPPGIQPNHPVQHVPEPIANPIARFYHQDDQPWSVLGMGMRHPGSHAHQSDFLHPHDNLGPYRQGPCSDIGSHVSPSDSGYQTLPTQSVLSIEPGRVDQELSLEVMNRAKNLTVEYSPTGSQAMARRASDQGSVSQRSTRSGNPRQQFPCPEPDCTTILKCQSEFKKHMTKHKKEWKCNVPGCKRGDEGFSTVNDLDRHKKSVHKMVMANSKSWQCAAGSCTNKHKIWPRLDNFKQHIDRMHKDENMFDLITRSEYHPQEAETVAQPLSVDPSHLLAGMGSDTALANGDPNGNTFSMNMPSFDYPSFMSISGRSNSSASQILPGTQSYDVSFLQSGTTSFNHTGGDLSVGQNFSRSTESLLAPQPSLRNSSCVSSTGKTTKPVSARGSKHNGNSKMEVPLSSAPQTKSEQLRQQLDLGKWSKAKLQKLVLQVLESHQDDDNASPGSDTCDMSKEIATILYQNFRPDRSPQRQDTQGSGSGTQRCPYKQCNFTGRNCDLNKHIKRHLKPYGCTYPKCHKRFGAKSDWKRHENSQHFQQEAFRCEYNNNRGKKCGEHYYCMEKFQEHLEEQHKINSADQIRKDLQRCKIGKNCQVQFWCGFCDSIQTLSQKRNDAWDERFDHIARHFEKDKKCIDDWICVEENKTKERIRKSVDRGAFPDNESRSSDEDREEETTMTAVMEGTAATFEMNSSSSSSMSNASRKRPASAEVIESQRAIQRRKTGTIVVYCCFCGYGGSTTLQKGCMDCQHIFCKSCRAEEVASLSSET